MVETEDTISLFLEAMKRDTPGKGDNWPLSGSQILPYFDADQAVDIYDKVNKLLEKGHTHKEIGKLFQRPTILRYLMNENGIIGLKVASILNIRKTALEERKKYVDNLYEILNTMAYSDPFCLDFKNQILSDKEVTQLKTDIFWHETSGNNKRIFLELGVDLFAFAWAFYYNLFVACGYEIHGPYEYLEDNKKYKLVIREGFNMNPKEIWGFDTGLPPIKLFLLYQEDVDFKLSFTNQPVSEEHNEKLIKCAVSFGNNFVTNPETVKTLTEKLTHLTLKMTKYVNSLTPMEQMKKGAEISFFMLRGIYDIFGEDWKPDRFVDPVIEKIGDKFLEKKKNESKERSVSEWLIMFDPRTDELGDVVLN